MVHAAHPLVGVEAGPRGLSGKQAERALARLVEGGPRGAEAHVALAGHLLLLLLLLVLVVLVVVLVVVWVVVVVQAVAVVHQGPGALVVEHVLPLEASGLCAV